MPVGFYHAEQSLEFLFGMLMEQSAEFPMHLFNLDRRDPQQNHARPFHHVQEGQGSKALIPSEE